MTKLAPPPVDVLDFQFKLNCKLKIFENERAETFFSPCNIVATTSRFGFVFLGTDTNSLQVIRVKDLEEYKLGDGEVTDYYRRTITLPSKVKHISLNCNETLLSVVTEKDNCPVAIIYDVQSFYKNMVHVVQEIRVSPSPGVHVSSAVWNPAVTTTFTVCKSDGSFALYDLKDNKLELIELPSISGATCMCWSPKGKQIAIGDRSGKITQYKPDLKAAKVINPPPIHGNPSILSLHWISNYQFVGIYKMLNDPNSNANVLVIDSPKTGETVYTNYEDICYSNGTTRSPQFYLQSLSAWNIMLVASSNSMEVGVLGADNDSWTQWILNDNSRAELPLSATKNDTLPVGMTVNYGTTKSLLVGENDMPPVPLLLLLSNYGILCCFHAINLKSGIASICVPPEPLSDQSGSAHFVKSNTTLSVATQPVSIKNNTTAIIVTTYQPVSLPNPSAINTVTAPAMDNIKNTSTANELQFKTAPTQEQNRIISNMSLGNFTTGSGQSLFATPIKSNQVPAAVESKPVKPDVVSTEVIVQSKEIDRMFAQKTREECINLEAEVKILLHRSKTINVDIGTEDEAATMANLAKKLYEFLKDVTDTCKTQAAEIHTLKQSVIQTWAWYEEAHSRYAVAKDPTMQAILKLQPLDPASVRLMTDIKHLVYYIESQLVQANGVLDEQWNNFQDSCKQTLKFKLPTVETIYQSMVRQNSILQRQAYGLKDIAARLKHAQVNKLTPPLLVSTLNVSAIEERIGRLQIEPFDALQIHYEKILERQSKLTLSKAQALKKLIKSHKMNRVPINKPQYIDADVTIKSFLTAPLSPIDTSKIILPQKPKIVQSTPLNVPSGSDPVAKPSLQKALFGATDASTKFSPTVPQLPATTKTSFTFANGKESPASAFVPTATQQTSLNLKTPTSVATNDGGTKMASLTRLTTTTADTNVGSFTITSTTNQANLVPFKSQAATTNAATVTAAKPATFTFTSPLFGGTKTTDLQSPEKPSTVKIATVSKSESSIFGATQKVSDSKSAPFGFSALSTNATVSSSTFPSSIAKGQAFASGAATSAATQQQQRASATTATAMVNVNWDKGSSTAVTSSVADKLTLPEKPTTTNSIFASSVQSTNLLTSTTAAQMPTTKPQTIFGVATSTASKAPFTFSTQASGSIFGAPATPTTAAAAATDAKSSFFNATSATTTQPPAMTFGTAPKTTSPSIFGASDATKLFTNAGKNIFGAAAPATSIPTSIPAAQVTTPVQTSTATITNAASPPSFPVATNKSIFGQNTINAVPGSIFGNSTNSTTSASSPFASGTSIFTSTTPIASATATSTPTATVGSTSIFGAKAFNSKPSTVETNLNTTADVKPFASQANTATTAFAATSNTTSSSPFVATPISTAAGVSPFVAATSTANSSPFGAATSSATSGTSPFAAVANAGGSTFGTSSSPFPSAVSSVSSPFSQTVAATTTSLPFGVVGSGNNASGSIFGSNANQFGTTTNVQTSTFGTTGVATSSSPFGTTAGFGQTSPFASNQPFGASNTFGTPTSATTTAGPFGRTTTSAPFGNSSSSNFSFSAAAANIPSTSSSTSSSFGFGNKPTFGFAATSESGLGFGSLNVSTTATATGFSSSFGQQQQQANPFGKAASTEQKSSPFSGGNIFGTPSTSATTGSIFGNASSTSPFTNKNPSTFGGTAPSAFGGTQNAFGQQQQPQQQTAFGQPSTGFGSNSPFGSPQSGGAFSGGNQGVGQTGFGSPTGFSKSPSGFGGQATFGGAPAFGSSPTFGGAPAFGSTSTFGAMNKVFGAATNETFANVAVQQQNSTFANLANQSTLGFGNLAQQTPPQQQQQESQSAGFGGGSFSTWR